MPHGSSTTMANVDIARFSAPVVASFELQSSLAHSHPLIVSHALSVAKTCSLLFEIYDLAYKSLHHIHTSSAMSRHSSTNLSPSNSSLQVNDSQRAPPQPDPEPAAPPIIILAQSGNKPAVQPRPQIQVPAPAEQGLRARPHTSSWSYRQTSRYNLRSRSNKQPFSRPPNKPRPQPEPHPAPPVIILSDEQQQQQHQQQQNQAPPPLNPVTPISQVPTSPTPRTNTPSHSAMGSKVSKVRERAQDGKLQPSQEQLDKEQMKEPSNYYTRRSKSMRRKAGKGGDAGGSAAGASGTT
ncbi:hypothetical protein COCC4DRAFT_75532 [Bipolaris maydis ATCC 48331]|uniref:Uncharacterized protein n=2 Tax=Cochliobolus heterostrophus TaxID=5016 RepID=M2SSY3_COCH5|nr:uncharacterized protein COCC4DRAFT_75532 [Bipolaris maydis ATCC 48331]EMD88455.1 hypothetical protein COCHEDRAFT_1181479 [Bipolaris maydis C5]ENI00706.1 hypothetical protein COCC4DRAFT_75532 [Bipolaris maydis ATCC 48331]KAJ6205923.1 hypothetical protein PSV09DRAFT_1181479 [Bipolaris maydis]